VVGLLVVVWLLVQRNIASTDERNVATQKNVSLPSSTIALSDFQSGGCLTGSLRENMQKISVGVSSLGGRAKDCVAPQVLIDQANKHISNLLGEKYFADNISFVPADTEQLFGRDDGHAYWGLTYADNRFVNELGQAKPLRFSLVIDAQNYQIKRGVPLPDCVRNKLLCVVKVIPEKALEIAKINGFDNNSIKFEYHIDFAQKSGGGWAWYFTQTTPRGKGKLCGTSKTLELNIVTEKISEVMERRADCVQLPSF